MAGNTLYLGNLFSDLNSNITEQVEAINSTVAKLQDIVDNTMYIKNLYNATGMRDVVTYTSTANTLYSRITTTPTYFYNPTYWGGSGNSSTVNTANLTMSSISFADNNYGNQQIYIRTLGYPKIKFTVAHSSADISDVYINDVLIESKTNGTYTVNIPTASDSILRTRLYWGGQGGGENIVFTQMYLCDVNGIPKVCLHSASVSNVSNAITISTNYIVGSVWLGYVTGISASGWDFINFIIDNKNENCSVNIFNSNLNLLMADVKDSSYIGDNVKTLTFYTQINLWRNAATDTTPALQSLSYKYLK